MKCFLTVAFHLFLMMADASSSNKIMFSIVMAVLFAIRIELLFFKIVD